LEASGWNAIAANATGLLLSSELNFILSYAFTWGDRGRGRVSLACITRRWVMFHGSVASIGVLNLVVFSVLSVAVPSLLAAVTGIGVAGLANYLLSDRLVFRAPAGVRRQRSSGPDSTNITE
jgi:putative flippase GtrA